MVTQGGANLAVFASPKGRNIYFIMTNEETAL